MRRLEEHLVRARLVRACKDPCPGHDVAGLRRLVADPVLDDRRDLIRRAYGANGQFVRLMLRQCTLVDEEFDRAIRLWLHPRG